MAEILLRGKGAPGSQTVDQTRLSGNVKGQILNVEEDNKDWGRLVTWPQFAWFLVPEISVSKVLKYVAAQFQEDPTDGDWTVGNKLETIYRYRMWTVRWADMPQSVKDRVQANNGVLTIKATNRYTGAFDYPWSAVKEYFRNLETGQDETEDLE